MKILIFLLMLLTSCHYTYVGKQNVPDKYIGQVVSSKCSLTKDYYDNTKNLFKPVLSHIELYYLMFVKLESDGKYVYDYVKVDEDTYNKYNPNDTIK